MRILAALFPVLLGVAWPVMAAGTASTCWIRSVTYSNPEVRVVFHSTAQLTFVGQARRVQGDGNPSDLVEYSFLEGQKLQVKSSAKARDRCELEAFVGPVNQGVSLGVWLHIDGAKDSFFMGSVRLAKPPNEEAR